jgi:hypothetical protein
MSFFESVKEMIGLEQLPTPVFRATIIGDVAAFFEGVVDVHDFTDEQIVLRLKKGGFIINGKNLYLKKYCEGDLVVCGKITSTQKI